MPRVAEHKFVRQHLVTNYHAALVIPPTAEMNPKVASGFTRLDISFPQPTDPPTSFAFHYIDAPVDEALLLDEARIDTGSYEFPMRDAVLSVFDLPALHDDEFSWSFSTTHCIDVLVALKIGETVDVLFEDPLADAFQATQHHFPTIVDESGFGGYPIHVTVDVLSGDGFRVVTSYEPHAVRTDSRLPFFFGFRVFGRMERGSAFPLWRELLADAVREALRRRWEQAILYVAFALEAFIDERLGAALDSSGVGERYIDHVLRVAERRYELHALNSVGPHLSAAAVNKTSDRLNQHVFSPRNDIAHGRRSQAPASTEFVRALKTTIAFIWDWGSTSRHLLVPTWPVMAFDSMVDERLIADCKAESEDR